MQLKLLYIITLISIKTVMHGQIFIELDGKSFNCDSAYTNLEMSLCSRQMLENSIFNELTKGIFKDETKKKFIDIIAKLKSEGADGIIFGCTEIALLIKQDDFNVTVFDTTIIHSKAAVDFALSTDLVT
jgi:aspartate racemase